MKKVEQTLEIMHTMGTRQYLLDKAEREGREKGIQQERAASQKMLQQEREKLKQEQQAKLKQERAKLKHKQAKLKRERAKLKHKQAKLKQERAKPKHKQAKLKQEREKAAAEKLAEKYAIALEFKNMGIAVEDIASGIGLSFEEIEKLM